MAAPELFSLIPYAPPEDLPEPDNGPYFLASKKGYLVHRRGHWGRMLVPTAEVPNLTEAENAYFWPDFNRHRLPIALLGQAWSFFHAIYELHHSEAMVDITWDTTHGYRLFVPPQRASGGSVEAKRTDTHYGRSRLVGTIHSHCNFDAFHSGTDKHDAGDMDGLHITIGHVARDSGPSIAIMIAAAGNLFDYKLEDIADGPLVLVQHPQWWERYVNKPTPTTQTHSYNNGYRGGYTTHVARVHGRPAMPHAKPTQLVTTGGAPLKHTYTSLDAWLSQEDPDEPDTEGGALWPESWDQVNAALDYITTILGDFGWDFDYTLTASVLGRTLNPEDLNPDQPHNFTEVVTVADLATMSEQDYADYWTSRRIGSGGIYDD